MPVSPAMSRGQLGASIAMQFWSFVAVSLLLCLFVNLEVYNISCSKLKSHQRQTLNGKLTKRRYHLRRFSSSLYTASETVSGRQISLLTSDASCSNFRGINLLATFHLFASFWVTTICTCYTICTLRHSFFCSICLV